MNKIENRRFEIRRISNFGELPGKNGVEEHFIFVNKTVTKKSEEDKTAQRETAGNRNI